MLPGQRLLRCVALVLLLVAAVDLGAIDLFAPAMCSDSTDSGSAAKDNDCFCCCAHIVFSSPPPLPQVSQETSEFALLNLPSLSGDRLSVYRPPKA